MPKKREQAYITIQSVTAIALALLGAAALPLLAQQIRPIYNPLIQGQVQGDINMGGHAITNAAPSTDTNGAPLYDAAGAAAAVSSASLQKTNSLSDVASVPAAQTNLALVPGVNVQLYNANTTTLGNTKSGSSGTLLETDGNGAGLSALPTNIALYPTLNQNTTGSAGSVDLANINGMDSFVKSAAALPTNGPNGLVVMDGSKLPGLDGSQLLDLPAPLANSISNSQLVQMAASSVKGNLTGSSAEPSDVALSDLASAMESGFYDGRYVQSSYTASAPAPTVTGSGTYPLYVLQTVQPKILLSSIANTSAPNFFSAQYFIYGKTGGNATQSVKIVSLPFTPVLRLSLQEVDGRGGSGINCIQWNNSGVNGGSTTASPAFPNNGFSSIYWQFVWTTANITCSAGDTLVMCTTSGGTGGSQFTFTADNTVSSSATVNVRAVLNGASAPTTSDTVVYDQTTGLSYTTTYSKNSATNSSTFPLLGIVWPSTNGSNIDVNYFCSNTGQVYLFNLYAF